MTVGIDMADQPCGTFVGPAERPAIQAQFTINCATPIRGNTVEVTRVEAGDRRITLCEVEVYSFMSRCNGLM